MITFVELGSLGPTATWLFAWLYQTTGKEIPAQKPENRTWNRMKSTQASHDLGYDSVRKHTDYLKIHAYVPWIRPYSCKLHQIATGKPAQVVGLRKGSELEGFQVTIPIRATE
jgi:hypothetical protein